ncbi:MAG: hypothetical protein EPN86_02405 [Nanoarchaeota archaeon]|nr:MAG: hypothetical protein EPN86_02405 [Nanoarchaeota archaeon]
MFQDLREKLESIDSVFNEERYELGNEADRRNGFDASKDYDQKKLSSIAERARGMDAVKKLGIERKYLLLQITLEEGENKYVNFYLRGFDEASGSHASLGENFLNDELRNELGDIFELPYIWPSVGYPREAVRDLVFEHDGLKLTVSGLGGGMYNLRDGKINLHGSSLGFGSVPTQYQERFAELLQQLVQKPAFQGYQVNVN